MTKAGTKKLQGRIIAPIFSVSDVLRTVPWIAEFQSKDHRHKESCESVTSSRKQKCKNPANWLYVFLDNTTGHFCTAHVFGNDCIGRGPNGDYAEVFRYDRWVRDNINTSIKSEG